MSRAIAVVALALLHLTGRSQVNDHPIRQEVLERGVCQSTCIFGKWSQNGGTETQLTLLGQVTDTWGRCFKVMTSVWIWGLGKRATNRILIFSGANRFLGQYDATTVDDLPDRLEQGSMVFVPERKEPCVERVDLTRGLPKRFFLDHHGEFVFY